MVPLQRLTHIGICVSDMDRALRFYRDCLGFRHEHELRVAGEPSDGSGASTCTPSTSRATACASSCSASRARRRRPRARGR